MSTDIVFYDGNCGFCHWSVQRLLAMDRHGTLFRYAPLNGVTFRARVPESDRSHLPDSLVVLTPTGSLLVRSDAVLHILRRVGGRWWLPYSLLRCLPRFLRDFLYDRLAAVRLRLFRRPSTVCPILPPDLRSRFDP